MRTLTHPEAALLRRPAPIRRRRWRLVPVFVVVLFKAVMLVAAPVAFTVWLLTSSYFAIEAVEVIGGQRVSTEWVEQTLAPLAGRNLWRVSLDGVHRRLADNPWVDRVELRRELPGQLTVTVVERVPVALAETPSGLMWVDEQGAAIASSAADEEAKAFVRLRHDFGRGLAPVGAALELVARLEALRPDWTIGVISLSSLGEGEFRVEGPALPAPMLVRATTLDLGVRRLELVWKQIEDRVGAVEVLDLRLPGRIVARPLPSPGGSGLALNEPEG